MDDSSLKSKLLKLTALRYQFLPELGNRLCSDDGHFGNILQCHLFAESLLEELIKLCLATNSDAVLSARLTFDQKLAIASRLELHEDWKLIPDRVIGSLRKLNSLRNKLVHRYGHEIITSDIREFFVGLEHELPYADVLDQGIQVAISRYAAFIFGNMLPKYESPICSSGPSLRRVTEPKC